MAYSEKAKIDMSNIVYPAKKRMGILRIKNIFVGQRDLMTDNARKANKKLRPNGYLYIIKIKQFDIYKIGVSVKPERRIKDIDSHMPFEIKVLMVCYFDNVYDIEEGIHENLQEVKYRKEWFQLHPDDAKELIRQMVDMALNPLTYRHN